jgi:tRNA A-37 threonylcarbamoyl transferase component Bud32
VSNWQIRHDVDAAAVPYFASLDAVFSLEGKTVTSDPMSHVSRVVIADHTYYIKCYAGLGKKPLRRWFAKSRVQIEWENLQNFARWGIPTAPLVAYGQEREGGRFLRGALITTEIPNTTDLSRLARTGDPRLKSRRWRDGIAHQLAEITRNMHDRRFTHGDLKWRNLLVDATDRIYLIDCPSGGFWWPPFLEYRIIKDLACLDKLGKRHLARSERLRFYLDYAGKQRLDDRDRQRIRKIITFFNGRDEDHETAASLRAAGRTPPLGCSIWLAGNQPLVVKRWLRILPGKRLTGIAHWRGESVLAKLFIAPAAERHWQRELQGAATLGAHGIPTPAALAHGAIEGGGYFVLYRFIADARTPSATAPEDLTAVFAQVGRMHAQGLSQQDIHLDNFLLQREGLLVIDGDAIRSAPTPQACTDNLALLFAQLQPATERAWYPVLLAAYRTAHPQLSIEPARLAVQISRSRQARLDDYLDKCLRDCSLFKVARRTDRFFSVVRAATHSLAPLLHDPDAWLEKGVPLKRGRTATLARIDINGRPLVIKRYNIKGAAHALSRCWRPSRAWHAWIEGHRLDFLGIATPQPLAVVERRFGPLRGKAWLISEWCPGEPLSSRWQRSEDVPPQDELDAVRSVFAQLVAARISHGDLKASNLLWHEGKIYLVDLDAMRQYDTPASFAHAWRKDHERFLRNWPDNSPLRLALAVLLQTVAQAVAADPKV